MRPLIWAFLIITGCVLTAEGQGALNPFDLTPRLAPAAGIGQRAVPAWQSGNPFDVAHAVVAAPLAAPRVKKIKPARPALSDREKYGAFIFAVTVSSLFLATILITMFRSVYQRAWRGLLNENMLNQIYRERQATGALPYYILYVFSMICMGTFIFLAARLLGANQGQALWPWWGACVAGVLGLLLAKHGVLAYLGTVFGIEKETGTYSFTIMIFGILLGLGLLMANVCLAYGPEAYRKQVLFTAFGIIGLVYVFRSLRGLFIANNFLASHPFHFFLYLCIVEIAPVFVLIKLVQNQA